VKKVCVTSVKIKSADTLFTYQIWIKKKAVDVIVPKRACNMVSKKKVWYPTFPDYLSRNIICVNCL